MTDLLNRVSPERKEKILARAEELIREERVRRGRFAPPDRIQNAADAGAAAMNQNIINTIIAVALTLATAMNVYAEMQVIKATDKINGIFCVEGK
ncbi:hypothetical protein ACTG4Q_20760 [Bradyrhizobium denitrificans]